MQGAVAAGEVGVQDPQYVLNEILRLAFSRNLDRNFNKEALLQEEASLQDAGVEFGFFSILEGTPDDYMLTIWRSLLKHKKYYSEVMDRDLFTIYKSLIDKINVNICGALVKIAEAEAEAEAEARIEAARLLQLQEDDEVLRHFLLLANSCNYSRVVFCVNKELRNLEFNQKEYSLLCERFPAIKSQYASKVFRLYVSPLGDEKRPITLDKIRHLFSYINLFYSCFSGFDADDRQKIWAKGFFRLNDLEIIKLVNYILDEISFFISAKEGKIESELTVMKNEALQQLALLGYRFCLPDCSWMSVGSAAVYFDGSLASLGDSQFVSYDTPGLRNTILQRMLANRVCKAGEHEQVSIKLCRLPKLQYEFKGEGLYGLYKALARAMWEFIAHECCKESISTGAMQQINESFQVYLCLEAYASNNVLHDFIMKYREYMSEASVYQVERPFSRVFCVESSDGLYHTTFSDIFNAYYNNLEGDAISMLMNYLRVVNGVAAGTYETLFETAGKTLEKTAAIRLQSIWRGCLERKRDKPETEKEQCNPELACALGL